MDIEENLFDFDFVEIAHLVLISIYRKLDV